MTERVSLDTHLTVAEAALRLRVSERTIARMIDANELEAPKVRRRRLVSAASVDRLLKAG